MPGRQMSAPTHTGEFEPSYTLIEQGRWQSLYSTHIHVSTALCFHMHF